MNIFALFLLLRFAGKYYQAFVIIPGR